MINTRNCIKKYKTVIILALCAIFALSGCGSNASTTQETAPIEELTTQSPQTVKKQGGELFIAMPTNVTDFNPLTAQNEDLINLLSLIYEEPIDKEYDGMFKGTLFNTWTVDSEKKVFTFVLRDNVMFSNGTPLTVDDVLYTAEKIRALDTYDFYIGNESAQSTQENQEGNTEENQNNQDNQDNQNNQNEEEQPPTPTQNAENPEDSTNEDGQNADNQEEEQVNRYAQYNSLVESIEKVDEKTLRLTMKEGGDAGLHFMMFPVMGERFDGRTLPMGTGPYVADSYQDNKMRLSINTFWWQEAPYITSVVASGIDKNADKLKAVDTSIIDFTTTDVLYSGKYKIQGKIQVMDYMTNYYDCIIPNMGSTLLQNVDVRRAISCAINRREIISTVLLNHGTSASVPIPPDFYAYESKYKFYEYDINYAKELLNKAGYASSETETGNKLSLKMIVLDDYNNAHIKEAARAIKKQLAEVNVELIIEELNKSEYLKRLESGIFDLAFASFYLDNRHILKEMFSNGGKYNYGSYYSEELETAVAQCEQSVEPEGVKKAYGNLQEILVNNIPQIGLYFRMNSIVCDNTLRDIRNPRQNKVFANIAQWYFTPD